MSHAHVCQEQAAISFHVRSGNYQHLPTCSSLVGEHALHSESPRRGIHCRSQIVLREVCRNRDSVQDIKTSRTLGAAERCESVLRHKDPDRTPEAPLKLRFTRNLVLCKHYNNPIRIEWGNGQEHVAGLRTLVAMVDRFHFLWVDEGNLTHHKHVPDM